ncbi:putative bifunctional diguanylate cyclase/phosphodiesterase [Saccharopolyspora cebuensis]|uniref:Bifunctional diguanylate cyclase/phosphodiesterase n=1 Tax=Saccharopolyspora cebuensis TaxID=418759 RepID=A0ABV4CB59_9PSEU
MTDPEGGAAPSDREALSRSRAALREHSGEGTVAIVSLDVGGRVVTWNAEAERLQGYTGEEIIGRHFSVFYPPEEASEGFPDAELTRTAEIGVHIDEGWRVRRDGTRFWAYTVLAAQQGESGDLRGFIKVIRDETETHARHQRSYQRFTDLFGLAPVGVAFFDEADRVRECNDALCGLLGRSRAELLGARGLELLHPDDQEFGLTAPRARKEAGGGAGQRVLARSDGQRVVCEVRSALSVQDDGSRFWLVVFQDVTERIRRTEELRYQVTHDPLTGLPNRQGVAELLASSSERMGLLLCDIDNFKRVNDSLGHAAGDELIVQAGRRLAAALPEGCAVARLSGDEFLVVLEDVESVESLRWCADHVARVLRMVSPIREHLVRVTASVGAAMFPSGEMTGEDLLRFADAAVFRAKRSGTGQVALADPAMATRAAQQVRMEGELAEALRTDGLELYYQPVVDAQRRIVTAEALLRWPHPEFGLLGPDVVLTTAEQGDLLREVDLWVLRTALREAADWPRVHGRDVRVALNLSAKITTELAFLETIGETLTGCRIDARRVVLEVTETSLVDVSTVAREGMGRLIERGATFAVDDFGTGYSSLARLKDLPAGIIKLDRQFVSGLEHEEADRAIVRSAIDLAHATGRSCVAEGVETAAQFELLTAMGADTFQGWLFARAMPVAKLRELLAVGSLPLP